MKRVPVTQHDRDTLYRVALLLQRIKNHELRYFPVSEFSEEEVRRMGEDATLLMSMVLTWDTTKEGV